MGLLETIARLFGKGGSQPAQSTQPSPQPPQRTPAHAVSADSRPVNIDLYPDDEDEIAEVMMSGDETQASPGTLTDQPSDENGRAPLLPPRNRQELVKELQKNYTEVLGLVRKVDDHLDTQSQRSERLLELAEQSARNMDAIPELVEQNRRVADALGDLIDLTRDSKADSDAAVDRLNKTATQQLEAGQLQTAALQKMQASIHRSGEAEAEMARSIGGFNETLTEMSSSTKNLGDTISQLRETDAEREKELAKLVSNSQKWLVAAVVFCALMAVAVVGLAINGVL